VPEREVPGASEGAGGGGPGGHGGTMGPRAIYQPLPEIPETVRHRALEVVAVARFQVAANGTAQVELIEPTRDPDLNRALLDSMKRWRFFPGMQDGKPVASTVDIRIPISVK
jgi:periplasmic protein TonB